MRSRFIATWSEAALCHCNIHFSALQIRNHMMEMQGVAVLNSILRPHLSLDSHGAARVQEGAIQPSRVAPKKTQTEHNVLVCGDPNSGGSV